MVYGMVILTLDNVLLPQEKLTPTPSFIDGLDEETEKELRITGCELIQTSGILLRLPQTAMATGQVLFQRFYCSKSFVRQAMEATAMACVYLASKIEESPRRIRDVINVFHHIRQVRSKKHRSIQPLILDPAYIRLKSDVTLAERRILKELGFCVHVKHPHKLIVIYMQQLGFGKEVKMVQMAWNFMNDALRSIVFVAHTPESIACACIYLSGRTLSTALPHEWFLVFDIAESELIHISSQIMDLYARPVINVDELEAKVELLSKAYQESRQKSRGDIKPLEEVSQASPVQSSIPATIPVASKDEAVCDLKSSSEAKDVHDINSKEHQEKPKSSNHEFNGGNRKHDDLPPLKRSRESRRSPSPIVYHESPTRHKHKKRRKITSSRSDSYDRKPFKKTHRHERSPSPDSDRKRHRKGKAHHR